MSQAAISDNRISAIMPELETQDLVWEEDISSQTPKAEEPEARWHNAVYECCDSALWRRRLVLTPYMLLDRLHACRELATEARDETACSEATQNRLDLLTDEVERLLTLLWRGGLWTDASIEEKQSCDGRAYHVLCEPFTDGKPHGRPLSGNAPAWIGELLGVTA